MMKRAFELSCVALFGMFVISACSGSGVEFDEQGIAAPESVDESELALMDLDHGDGNNLGSCKGDCLDKCAAKGASTSECSKKCAKACIGAGCNGNNWQACAAGSNSSSGALCLFFNGVWELSCNKSEALSDFCWPFGGCSGCRKKMDNACK